MRILVLGATGMLGSTVFRVFDQDPAYKVWGTIRSPAALHYFPDSQHTRILTWVDVLDQDALASALARVRPDIVINCVGMTISGRRGILWR